MSQGLVLLAIVTAAASGVPGFFFNRKSNAGHWVTALQAVVGSGLGLAGLGWFWATGESEPITWPWPLIAGVQFHVDIDALSAVLLLPIFLISLLGAIYGLEYWRQSAHPQNGRKLRFFYGILTAGMALLVIARDGILFLFCWEVMALSAFFLVATEDEKPEVREASWTYLVATHVAALCLFALFALLHAASGTFALAPLDPDRISPGMRTAVFALALVAFGLKAGIMPLHVWLPSSHAIAPSHVSAIMSGVIIKMGIYGLFRVTSLLPAPPLEWGTAVLVLGVASGVLGVVFAIGQHDLKRLLAYHSIENIGIIVVGLGLAMIGRTLNRPDWVVLGLCGGLLHVWNHALFKALLFLSAGSVIHATHAREIDHLGGLAKRMPQTAACFLIGAIAICGLPPLNGFVSEFLIYLGLFSTLGDGDRWSFAAVAFAAPALAMIGALAVACFVKVYGAVFLGTARSESGETARESPLAMTGPMAALAGCCIFIGVVPFVVAPVFNAAARTYSPELGNGPELSTLAPLQRISQMALLLLGGLLVVGAALWLRLRRGVVLKASTWGCGYLAPTPRMQYTASSFAQMLVGLFGWALRPRSRTPTKLPLFPAKGSFHSEVPDTVLDDAVLPAFRFGASLFARFRVFQQGSVQGYLLYIFLALMVLLLWR